jgi:hypothetical protein
MINFHNVVFAFTLNEEYFFVQWRLEKNDPVQSFQIMVGKFDSEIKIKKQFSRFELSADRPGEKLIPTIEGSQVWLEAALTEYGIKY